MTDRPNTDPAWLRGMTMRRVSRRFNRGRWASIGIASNAILPTIPAS